MSEEPTVDVIIERRDRGAPEKHGPRTKPIARLGMKGRRPRTHGVTRGMKYVISDHPSHGLAARDLRREQ